MYICILKTVYKPASEMGNNYLHINSIKIISVILIVFFCGWKHGHALPYFNSITPNNDTIGKYDLFELHVDMTASFINPYNYDELELQGRFTSPSGTMIKVDGFYTRDYILNPPGNPTPDGPFHWKIRFSPTETGTWTYDAVCTDATGTTYSATYYFECVASSNPGFISNTNGYFQKFDNGDPFFSIGMDMSWSFESNGLNVYEEWIDSLANNEANFFKIIMAHWSFGIEWSNTGLGNYTNRLHIAFFLDWIIELAAQEGIYIQLCPLIHNEVSTLSNNDWASSPYKASNGGPCTNTWNCLSNTTAKYYYKRKLRDINARWGYSPFISAWELFSETDNIGD